MSSPKKSALALTTRLTSLVALLLIFYALADVTFLQAYCGNEAVGIPPAHHLSNSFAETGVEKSRDSDSVASFQNESPSDGQPAPHEGQDDECFCCCSHVVAGYFFIDGSVHETTRIGISSATFRILHPSSQLTSLFRPPQTT